MADGTRRVSVHLSPDDVARVKAGLREVGETGQRSLEQIKVGAERASRSLDLLDVAVRGVQIAGLAAGARALVQAGDALTQGLSRLQNATGSAERAGQVYEALYRNALQTGVAVSESVDAFQRFSIAARGIGATSDQVVRLVGGLQRVAVVSGASAGEISSARGTCRPDPIPSATRRSSRTASAWWWAFAQVGVVGFDGQVELEALRLLGLPEAAPAVLHACPSVPVGTREFAAEATWDLPPLAPGATGLLDVAVAGCRQGDLAQAALASSTRFVELDAAAWTTSTVRVMARNTSPGAALDLGPATLSVQVTKRRVP